MPDPQVSTAVADAAPDASQILYNLAMGAQPDDFHPAAQPLAQGYSLLFQPQPTPGPGLLGSPDQIQQAIAQSAPAAAAPPAASGDDDDTDQDDVGDDDGDDAGDVGPAAAQAPVRTSATSYPKTLDPTVERHVADYNQAQGLKPGDKAYLDPDLIKAMIRQEAGHDTSALKNDPMQVNNPGDWTDKKAVLGLVKGVGPGQDLGIKAGISWLAAKTYPRDNNGAPHFAGWPAGVRAYNSRNAKGTAYAKSVMNHLAEIKRGD